jgi:Lhr-like helicase
VQLRTIAPLLEGRDLVLQAATGVGKTEAVLAPCLERLIRSGRASTLLYVVPTRALAVDLERRLAPVLNERLGLRLAVRTGDVKRAGGRAPDMLVTTPESLDVALGSGNAVVESLPFIKKFKTAAVMCGDTPLLTYESIYNLLLTHDQLKTLRAYVKGGVR